MNAQNTVGVVLARTNFSEADRIVTILTPDQGKLRLMARGVRKQGSKLAGGIELFSVSQLSYIPGRKDIGMLVSSRIDRHFGNIVKSIERTLYAYELLKTTNKQTEDLPEAGYYELLVTSLAALDNPALRLDYLDYWYKLKLLELSGLAIDLDSDVFGDALDEKQAYNFDLLKMGFLLHQKGDFTARHLKLLRLSRQLQTPEPLNRVRDGDPIIYDLHRLMTAIAKEHI